MQVVNTVAGYLKIHAPPYSEVSSAATSPRALDSIAGRYWPASDTPSVR